MGSHQFLTDSYPGPTLPSSDPLDVMTNLANEAATELEVLKAAFEELVTTSLLEIERAVAEEREACAKVAEAEARHGYPGTCHDIANGIRMRGGK